MTEYDYTTITEYDWLKTFSITLKDNGDEEE